MFAYSLYTSAICPVIMCYHCYYSQASEHQIAFTTFYDYKHTDVFKSKHALLWHYKAYFQYQVTF